MASYASPDVVVLGAGAAGLNAAALSSMLGAKTMLVEKDRFGGDCTWTGCVPSKTLLGAARRWKIAAGERGEPSPAEHGRAFRRAMERVRSTRERIYRDADTPERFESMGVSVRIGKACFMGPDLLRIEGMDGTAEIRPRYIMVATGSRPHIPEIPGLEDVRYLTTETVFDLSDRPSRLVVVGGGPTGIELAQAFTRFGVRVSVLEREERILARFPPALVDRLSDVLRTDGVAIRTGVRIDRVEQYERGVRVIVSDSTAIEADALLVAAGRVARTDDIGVEAARLRLKGDLLDIDSSCRTNLRHIYGIGDVATRARFTHAAGVMARTAVFRALFKVPGSFEPASMPFVVHTDPGIGVAGVLDSAGSDVRVAMEKIDRAVIDGHPFGEVCLRTSRTGRILGASVLASDAGELTGLFATAIGAGTRLRRLSEIVFPYPTRSEVLGRAVSRELARRIPDRIVRLAARLAGLKGDSAGFDPDQIA